VVLSNVLIIVDKNVENGDDDGVLNEHEDSFNHLEAELVLDEI